MQEMMYSICCFRGIPPITGDRTSEWLAIVFPYLDATFRGVIKM